MIRQYIRRYNENGMIENVGCFVADKDQNGEIHIGWSLLNPRDKEEVKRYNKKVKDVNSISWKALNQSVQSSNKLSESELEALKAEFPVERKKPLFDKQTAVEIALSRATPVVSLSSIKTNSREKIHNGEVFRFIQRVTSYFKDGVVKISA